MYGEAKEVGNGAGAPADRAERASGCQERQPIIRVNPATGNRYYDYVPAKLQVKNLKHHVPNLIAYLRTNGTMIKFELVSNVPLDESDARDAQCQAGWHDMAHGFFGFICEERDGHFVATWDCAEANSD